MDRQGVSLVTTLTTLKGITFDSADGRDSPEVVAHNQTAHTLCHPTNIAFRG